MMGAHTSLQITHAEARAIWREHVNDTPPSMDEIERFFDAALDAACYNVVFTSNEGATEGTDPILVGNYVRDYIRDNPDKRPFSVTDDNMLLRELLAIRVCGANLYRRGGELQDNTVMPTIDFKRDSAADIARKLVERNENTWAGVKKLLGG